MTDIPVPGMDYDEDGRADITVYRARTGEWLYLKSSTGYSTASYGRAVFGTGGDNDALAQTDVPVVGDFDYQSTNGFASEPAVWRPSTGIWTIKGDTTYTKQWGQPIDAPINGVKKYPFVSPMLARTQSTLSFETTALAIPPNTAGCDANGATFMSGTPYVYKDRLTCWKSGTNCSQSSFDLRSLDVAPAGSEDTLADTDDNNIIRMNNGHVLVEHLSVRYEPTIASHSHRQGIALFYDDQKSCGTTWQLTNSSLTKANFSNDWTKTQLDQGHLYNNPYSGRVYFSVQNDLDNNNTGLQAQSLLYYSTNYAASWNKYSGATILPFFGGSYHMTASPSGREYLFGCPNNRPTLFAFNEATNSLSAGSWSTTWAANQVCSGIGLEGAWQISFVASEEDGDFLRIAYPQPSGGRQVLHLANVQVTGTAASPVFTMVSENVIAPAAATGNIFGASMIEPDQLDMPKGRQTNATLLYWVETDGPINATTNAAGPGVMTTEKGVLLRDMNLWAPVFPIVKNGAGGTPLTWAGWSKAGDYARAGFAYDAASDMLQYFPLWVGADNATWNTNFISAHP